VPYREKLYAVLPRGALLARYGVGYDSVDTARATEAGVFCTNTPDVLQQSVAEITMFMIGAAARHLLPVAASTTAGEWAPRQGVELQGKTLAIIGCGEIGRAVARIAAAGFGMRVVGYRRRPGAALEHFERVSDDFAAVVSGADFVSLHIPGSPENHRFLNAERLALIPSHAWLVNTARGSVVDEAALYDALAAGRLRGAALDVFEREPYQPVDASKDLRTLPQAIMLPHVGSNTAEANARMAERALRNVRLAEAGDFASMDLLNREVAR
jgi:phosphoglycerate dehydrogenase-like enzyme